jgi:2-hydroxy-6-oxo-6-(2'-aminophenyl)hexa-2,4-dienoate hydrolase
MKQFKSNYVAVDGIRTHFLDEGQGNPIVLVHGGGAGADSFGNWRDTISILAPHGRIVAVDMLGFGKTEKPNGSFVYSQDARNRHFLGFIETLGLRSATLVGNSMGGATCIDVAVRRPELVDKLVLMGSAGLTTEIHKDLLPVVNYDFTREGMVRLIRALVNERFEVDDELVTYRHHNSLDADTRRAYGAAMGWIREQGGLFYDEALITRVNVPTLVVNGKKDKVVPLANAIRFLELIGQSWGYIIPDCGHWAMIEHPADFAHAVLHFRENCHA